MIQWVNPAFEQLYGYAVHLIDHGKAYVDSLTPDEMREHRGTLTQPGRESPYRNRSVEENRALFAAMRAGEFPDGAHVLRAKIDMQSPNINMRDPVLYRIRRAHHHRTGDAWCIYPMYDFAHPPSDAIEGITHSLCTLEFEDHRPLYDWLIENLPVPARPRQIEFARLNLTYTVMSKRKLLELVQRGDVSGWDDPRMPTIVGLRRRGYTPESIRETPANVPDYYVRLSQNALARSWRIRLLPINIKTVTAGVWFRDAGLVPAHLSRPAPFSISSAACLANGRIDSSRGGSPQ